MKNTDPYRAFTEIEAEPNETLVRMRDEARTETRTWTAVTCAILVLATILLAAALASLSAGVFAFSIVLYMITWGVRHFIRKPEKAKLELIEIQLARRSAADNFIAQDH